jgi:hypothetical protein
MKKTLTFVTLLAGAVAAYSQGTVNTVDYGSSYTFHVYNNQTTAPTGSVTAYTVTYNGFISGTEYYGNVSNDKPTANKGNAVYDTGTALSGAGFDAQLLAAPNTGDSLSALSTLGGVLHYYTSATLIGTVTAGTTTTIPAPALPGPASEGGTGGTVALAAWVNSGTLGAAATLLQAQEDNYAWGISPLSSIASLGGTPAGYTPVTPPTIGIDSFSIALPVPEPSTIALAVMGASALLFRRRK